MSSMRGDRWHAVSPYLDRALALSDRERAVWLTSLRARDPGLAAELKMLLDEHRALAQARFLENSQALLAQPALAGQTVGAYRLVSSLGEGGMATVWLAERSDGRFEGRAAVKFLNLAFVQRAGEERFKREGSILGRLTHPHIARLLDAGVSQNGQPYLVLEHVDGQPIDEYCDNHGLNLEERISLVLDVMSAVAHAHANLIVHRDIKPSNVLVAANGQVKLLDFGVAKLLEEEGVNGATTMLTREGEWALTPACAAPEQLTGGTVTTATDVYALGVLLYLLLTRQHPAGSSLRSHADLVKAIVEIKPLRPSEVVARTKNEMEIASANTTKRTAPQKLRRLLRGDLDTIVAKALKKNPLERYASVTALADDLRRHLRHEPISARPDTIAYRATKFVRRNRTAVALATVALIASAAGIVGTLIQARTARAERDFAQHQLKRAEAINDINNFLLSNAAPSGKPFTVNDLLGRGKQVAERQQGPGALDLAFNGTGNLLTDFSGGHEVAHAIAIDRRGRIVAVGTTSTSEFVATGYGLARYSAQGRLDWTVKAEGIPVFNPVLAIDSLGRIVVAGTAYSTCCGSMFLTRRNDDGTLDTTFGRAGSVITHFSPSSFDQGYGVTIDSLNRILVTGSSNARRSSDFAIARFNSDGQLDTNFGVAGKVLTDISGSARLDGAIAVAVDNLGRVVVAGNTYAGGSHDFALSRYHDNGSADTTFGSNGQVVTDFSGTGSYDVAYSAAIDSSGRIVVAGFSNAGGSNDFAMARYNLDGSLDQTFGSGGRVLTNFSGRSDDQAYAVVIDSVGRIVLVGHSSAGGTYDFAVARYDASGALDSTFGIGGKVLTDFSGAGSDDGVYSVAIDGRGRIVVAGYSGARGTYDFALAAYQSEFQADQSLDEASSPNASSQDRQSPPIAR